MGKPDLVTDLRKCQSGESSKEPKNHQGITRLTHDVSGVLCAPLTVKMGRLPESIQGAGPTSSPRFFFYSQRKIKGMNQVNVRAWCSASTSLAGHCINAWGIFDLRPSKLAPSRCRSSSL